MPGLSAEHAAAAALDDDPANDDAGAQIAAMLSAKSVFRMMDISILPVCLANAPLASYEWLTLSQRGTPRNDGAQRKGKSTLVFA